jgi:hypothetical protein
MPLGEFRFSTDRDTLDVWAGGMSHCRIDGPIIRFMKNVIENLPIEKDLLIVRADGFCSERNYFCLVKNLEDLEFNSKPNDIIGIICTRNMTFPRTICLPLDDESFEKGVAQHLDEKITAVPWNEKKPVAFWRGSPTGAFFPHVRFQLVLKMWQSSLVDAKFTDTGNPFMWEKTIYFGKLANPQDSQFWQPVASFQDHVRHKYILIVDGNIIASSHQWVFASGSVPILLTHPGNDWWFKAYLKPMENYVPVDYNLSDLEEKVQWLLDNDDKAKEIAENARKFAETILSSDFQKEYLVKRIQEVSQMQTQ